MRQPLDFSPLSRPPLKAAAYASAVLGTALLSILLAVPAARAEDDDEHASPRGVVYVESNIAAAGQNSILAYRQDREGELSPLPGSPFLTHGRGVVDPTLKLGPFDSDQEIITNAERTLLFAVNPGSNTIAVFRIHADGTLQHVEGSPFPSGGSNPVSLGLSRDTLVVVNKSMDPARPNPALPNYTAFHVSPEGELAAVASSSISVAPGNSPSQALISPDARYVFGADFLGGLLQSFLIEADGTLKQNVPQQLPAAVFAGSSAPHLPLGLSVHPNRAVMYAGFVTINRIGVYQYDPDGVLSFVRSVPDSGAAVCWIRLNLEGTRLYASNTGDHTISVFDTSDPLKPVEMQRLTLKGVGGGFQIELDPRGRTLYAVSQRDSAKIPLGQGNNLHVMKVLRDGRLREQEDSPLALPVPGNIRPQGLATF
ncbi:MAG: lactonase family protein [Steroidobacteraceae bacterium]